LNLTQAIKKGGEGKDPTREGCFAGKGGCSGNINLRGRFHGLTLSNGAVES
jgi:hypothetical protein